MGASDLIGKRSKGERRAIFWVAGALVLHGVSARAEIVDRVAAVVDRDVITLSEAEQAAELRALRGQEELSMAEVVERLIDARLVDRTGRTFEGSRTVTVARAACPDPVVCCASADLCPVASMATLCM